MAPLHLFNSIILATLSLCAHNSATHISLSLSHSVFLSFFSPLSSLSLPLLTPPHFVLKCSTSIRNPRWRIDFGQSRICASRSPFLLSLRKTDDGEERRKEKKMRQGGEEGGGGQELRGGPQGRNFDC